MKYSLDAVGYDFPLRPDFQLGEWASPGSPRVVVRASILDVAQRLRDAAGPVFVNSGYRTWAHHVDIYRRMMRRKGRPFELADVPRHSAHLSGHAGDLDVLGETPEAVAQWAERQPEVTGVGRYDTFTHIDTKPGGKRRWDHRTEPTDHVPDGSALLDVRADGAGRGDDGDLGGAGLLVGLRRVAPVGVAIGAGGLVLRELLPSLRR